MNFGRFGNGGRNGGASSASSTPESPGEPFGVDQPADDAQIAGAGGSDAPGPGDIGAGDGANGGGGGAGGNGDGKNNGGNGNDNPTDHVNKQIVDAVRKSTKFVFTEYDSQNNNQTGGSGVVPAAGVSIAYDKAAQAAAYAFQDATDYQRNVLSISNVAQGKALAMMFADKENIEKYAVIYVLAMVGSFAAGATAGFISDTAGKSLNSFPPNAPSSDG